MYTIDYRYVRPQKAEALKKWYDAPYTPCAQAQIWRGENATILPLRKQSGDDLLFGRGGVVDRQGNYVPLSAVVGRVQFDYPFDQADYRDQKVVYCGYLVHQWGHFLIEGAARLWYFLENDPTIDKYVFFLGENEQREIKGNYREFLELLKIWDKLEIINRPTTYREVVVPELGYAYRDTYNPKYLDVFEAVANNITVDPAWKAYDKVYCSRSLLAKAQPFEFGFGVLDNFFEKNGYQILYPERLPLSQMIFYIRNCQVFAALQGSLTHNILFGRNGQTMEIVERQVISDDNQRDIIRMKDIACTYIDANIPIYTIDCVGPYIMGYTQCMQSFARDRNYLGPDERYLTQKYYKKCFVQYMKAYQDLYRYNWFYLDWYAPFAQSQLEGFQEGHSFFGDYLDGKRPFLWHHYFEWHYLKQFVKRILVSCGFRKEL